MKRIFLLAIAAFAALGAVVAPALAQYPYTLDEPDDWFFYSVEGSYLLSGGYAAQYAPGIPVSVIPGSSWRGGAKAGLRFDREWDAAIGVNGTLFPTKTGTSGTNSVTDYGFFFTADLEAGYRMMYANSDFRLVGGLRGLWYHQNTDLTGTDPSAPAYLVMGSWGVGPRLGVEAKHQLGDSNFSLFGAASGAVLFGQLKQVRTYTGTVVTTARFNTIFNADAKAGMSLALTPQVNVGLGYRLQYLGDVDLAFKTTNAAGAGTGTSSRLFHGPFIEIWGAM